MWWCIPILKSSGRPKGSKDKLPRVRGISKVDKSPEAYKAMKKYIDLEKEYNKIKMLKKEYRNGTSQQRFYTKRLRRIRQRQADLYEIIAENHLAYKLAEKLNIGITQPYRRYLRAKGEGTKWKHKNK